MHFKTFTLMIITLLLSACEVSTAKTEQSPYFHAASLYPIELSDDFTIKRKFSGFITASQRADLGFELSGKIADIYADTGDHIHKGQKLAQLDITLISIEKQQFGAQLAETQARLVLNQANLTRLKALKKEGYASQQRLDELYAEQDVINAGIRRYRAALNAVQTKIDKSTLKAPFDGRIVTRSVDMGSIVNPGNRIFTLLNHNTLEAKIGIPQRFLSKLPPGSLHTLALGEESLNAKVITVGANVSNTTRTVPVRLELITTASLLDGSLIQLTLTEQINQSGYWIPTAAITDGLRGLWTVYAAVPSNVNNDNKTFRIEPRSVQVHYTDSDRLFILADLTDISWLIADGLHRFVPGQQVRQVNALSNNELTPGRLR